MFYLFVRDLDTWLQLRLKRDSPNWHGWVLGYSTKRRGDNADESQESAYSADRELQSRLKKKAPIVFNAFQNK